MRRSTDVFEPSGFFVLRTPLLSFDELLASSGDPAPEERLRRLRERAEVSDALHLASPSLTEALADPASERARRAAPVLTSYLVRMCSRPTPFGLFAGCAVGTLGDSTRLDVAPAADCGRHTRLDNDYLAALVAALEHDAAIRAELTWRPNSSLYRAGGRLRYAEARVDGLARTYHLVAVDDNAAVQSTLELAARGAAPRTLAEALVDDEITLLEAEAFVDELIDAQLLVSDLQLRVTGDEPIRPLAARLSSTSAGRAVGDRLDQVRGALDKIDAAGPGARIEEYRWIQSLLEPLPVAAEPARLFQVDATKPPRGASLGPRPVAEMLRAVDLLHRIAPRPVADGPLARFRDRFVDRYDDREVPLLEVLDEEIGIGFDSEGTAESAPLLEGLALHGAPPASQAFGPREDLLLGKLSEALRTGSNEIDLAPDDVDALTVPEPERAPLPDALEIMATLAAPAAGDVDAGDFRLLVTGISGPSGARLLGRFCHADAELHERVVEHLRAEEAGRPDAVFAEIVHLPEGRLGNILCRPVLRAYEIPFLGESGAPPDHQIPVSDLVVSVAHGRVVLRSRRLEREVLPRLTTAHNFGLRSLGVYRFLCSLQVQGTATGLGWTWGALAGAPFLPRVTCGRLVLSRATWRLRKGELAGDIDVQALRATRGLPRFVALADGDNELVIDLDNPVLCGALAHHLKRHDDATLVELFPGPDELCALGLEGRYTHEVVVAFVRATDRTAPAGTTPDRAPSVRRSFSPGSEWLYAKLYTGAGTVDRVLIEAVRPLVDQALAEGLADSWFFIRYGDPHWHVRLRLRGRSEALLPLLHAAAAPLLDDGRLWRIQLDTYEREIERYGGDAGIALSEELFRHDSDAVLALVESLWGDAGLDARWRLALVGIDLLLDDLGLDPTAREAWARERRDGFAREFGVDGQVRRQLGERFRRERADLEHLLDGGGDEHPLQPGIDILRRRSDAVAPVVAQLRDRGLDAGPLTASYAHMYANRLLRSAHRAQEMVIYDLLHRLYAARLARSTS